ncbi:MAG TPA: hypothetical protein VGD69_25130 [Herpetosiphonaceae bacterium]
MATIALRVPTALPGQAVLPSGQCYILFTRGPITARELIAEKVRAELRKARSGGMSTTSLPLLLPEGVEIGFGPLDEQLAIVQACRSFTEGQYLLLYNGRPLVDLDEEVELNRQTVLIFVYVPSVLNEIAARRLKDAA